MSTGMRAALLQQAERLIRTRGYAAFSYNDLAVSNAIRKASIHHYFPRKEDLVAELVANYMARFRQSVSEIEAAHKPLRDRLHAYGRHFLDGMDDGMLPLCGALSAERAALPESLRGHAGAFFQMQLGWLTHILRQAMAAGELQTDQPPERLAMLLLSTLEGGCLIAWAMDGTDQVLSGFDDVVARLLGKPERPCAPPKARKPRAARERAA